MARPSPAEAAAEILRRDMARECLVSFAQAVPIPGAPVGEEGTEDEWLFKPVETGLAAHHLLTLQKTQACLEERYGRLMIFEPPGSAKALALDTPIPTPDGWTTMGQLRVGDRVFDENGQPCNVTWVSPIHRDRPVYGVRTDCGDEIVADVDHEWRVALERKPRAALKGNGKGRPPRSDRDDPASRYAIKETRELVRRRSKRPMIERAKALDLPVIDLPLDPYVLGVWLGDGTSDSGSVTASEADMPWLRAELARLGYETRDRSIGTMVGIPGIRGKLVALGVLGNKHIPARYLRGSEEQRLALLHGLMDTDGTVCKRRGCATFCNTNLALAEGFRELVRSLGRKAGWSEGRAMLGDKDCGPVYRVSFYHAQAARMPRKAALCRDQYRTPNTYIDLIERPRCDTVCIEVDSPSHLFLCGRSMTPTHNSTYCGVVAPAWALGRWPGFNWITTSYADKPAQRNSRRCRQIVSSPEYRAIYDGRVRLTSSAVDEWGLSNDSTSLWKGIEGGITSARADAVLIDDPVANRAEAESSTVMDSRWAEYNDTIKSRLKPGGSLILIQTRWAPDDLAGRILPEDWNGESGRIMCRDGFEWEVLCIAAKCERKDDPLGRQIGEYLWPEWFDDRHWANFEPNGKDPGRARTWASLYQQRPRPDEGNQVEPHWIKWYDPDSIEFKRKPFRYYGASDWAVTEKSASNEPDWSEHGVFGMDPEGDLYGVDWWWGQVTLDKSANAEIDLGKRWKVSEWWGAKGKDENAVAPMRKRLQRERAAKGERGVYYHRELLPDHKDKIAKFASFRGYLHAGCVYLPLNRDWAIRLADQLCKFRGVDSDTDDAVDVCGLIGRGLDQMRDPKAIPDDDIPLTPAPMTLNTIRRQSAVDDAQKKRHYR